MNRHINRGLKIIIEMINFSKNFSKVSYFYSHEIILYQSRNKYGCCIWSPYKFNHNAWNQKSFFLRN